MSSYDVVICGAGIAGVAAADALTARGASVLLVDERPPLSLTSDKSSECYRNWWPGPDNAMVALMNRSIDLIDALAHETQNAIALNRRGYLYVTTDPAQTAQLQHAGETAAALGAGPLRTHVRPDTYTPSIAHGFDGQPDGADLILDRATLRRFFPCLADAAVAALHVRRCGWLSAQQLGMILLERACSRSARLLRARVEAVEVTDGRVSAVWIDNQRIATGAFVNAAGPFLRRVGRMVGVDLPVFSERHLKVAFEDHLGIIPRDAPLLICADPQAIAWTDDERAMLADDPEAQSLLDVLPAGAHCRPEGGTGSTWVIALWAYDAAPVEETFPLPAAPYFFDVTLRGLTRIIPALEAYIHRPPRPTIDGGYYTKTRENRPLIGPAGPRGSFVMGAFSGYGIMAACGAADVLAAYLSGEALPAWAAAFHPARYDDPAYRALLDTWNDTGQL
ncbi:NAD(P)/FAD-dependent oxidoreductase [Roseiflexus sp. RS-1]|uniref:NAD(P)/FAD-dependent oxidoreductase n=1 Tax=Roseiflexus sp. (strain RS-1) TaxID=357808 RepID=UPI0000D815D2|nr:FAD-binding oxidoreductase [Roseiflexus sp. RS-1]ABQ89373.1 FAD dependent oxidoreductase [Roseiflexus sp. RS-1]